MLKAKEDVRMMFARFQRGKIVGLCELELGMGCTDYDCAMMLCNKPARLVIGGLFADSDRELCDEHFKIVHTSWKHRKR